MYCIWSERYTSQSWNNITGWSEVCLLEMQEDEVYKQGYKSLQAAPVPQENSSSTCVPCRTDTPKLSSAVAPTSCDLSSGHMQA